MSRLTVVVSSSAVLLAAPDAAHADDKQICSEAHAQTQILRKESKLEAARTQVLTCAREVCPEFIRADCMAWVTQVESSLPTVVFAVKDAQGNDVIDARVAIDGRPWLPSVDATAHPVDPGAHTFLVTLPGGVTAVKKAVIREGEKNVPIVVTLPPASAPGAAPVAAPPPASPPPEGEPRSGSIAPWIVGGAGLGLMAIGGVFGIVTLGQKSTFDDNCDDAGRCNAAGDSARDTGNVTGPLTTVMLVAGGIGVGVGVVLLATDGSGEEQGASLHTGPAFATGGGGWRVGGRF